MGLYLDIPSTAALHAGPHPTIGCAALPAVRFEARASQFFDLGRFGGAGYPLIPNRVPTYRIHRRDAEAAEVDIYKLLLSVLCVSAVIHMNADWYTARRALQPWGTERRPFEKLLCLGVLVANLFHLLVPRERYCIMAAPVNVL
jgi:hypothetical protein